jgi:hypothetical protein
MDNLLKKPDVTIREILEDDDCVQEVRYNNNALIKYLCKYENMKKMIEICTV